MYTKEIQAVRGVHRKYLYLFLWVSAKVHELSVMLFSVVVDRVGMREEGSSWLALYRGILGVRDPG